MKHFLKNLKIFNQLCWFISSSCFMWLQWTAMCFHVKTAFTYPSLAAHILYTYTNQIPLLYESSIYPSQVMRPSHASRGSVGREERCNSLEQHELASDNDVWPIPTSILMIANEFQTMLVKQFCITQCLLDLIYALSLIISLDSYLTFLQALPSEQGQ